MKIEVEISILLLLTKMATLRLILSKVIILKQRAIIFSLTLVLRPSYQDELKPVYVYGALSNWQADERFLR